MIMNTVVSISHVLMNLILSIMHEALASYLLPME